MSYVFPPEFSKERARTFAEMIQAAYSQLAAFQEQRDPVYPSGWDIVLPQFAAHELGGGMGLGEVVEDAKTLLQGGGGLLDRVQNAMKVHEGNRLPFGFVARQGGEVVVVIRGTNTPMEWVADARALPVAFEDGWGSTTRGFMGLYSQLLPQILEALRPLVEGKEITTIYVTGHSLGGALATLISAGIYLEFQDVGPKPVTYTISSPRAVDPEFAKAHDAAGLETWRVFNTEDLVPTLPLAALDVGGAAPNFLNRAFGSGYHHVGYPIAVTAWYPDLVANHSALNVCGAL